MSHINTNTIEELLSNLILNQQLLALILTHNIPVRITLLLNHIKGNSFLHMKENIKEFQILITILNTRKDLKTMFLFLTKAVTNLNNSHQIINAELMRIARNVQRDMSLLNKMNLMREIESETLLNSLNQDKLNTK